MTGLPNRLPADNAGKNSSTARVSITICARRPAPRRSLMNTRQAEVKPKAAWYRVRPSAAPTNSSNTCLKPAFRLRNHAPASSKAMAIKGAPRRRGSGVAVAERPIGILG
ncbi:hypothetical protein D3C76_1525930 [compost metagenome]